MFGYLRNISIYLSSSEDLSLDVKPFFSEIYHPRYCIKSDCFTKCRHSLFKITIKTNLKLLFPKILNTNSVEHQQKTCLNVKIQG